MEQYRRDDMFKTREHVLSSTTEFRHVRKLGTELKHNNRKTMLDPLEQRRENIPVLMH